MNDVGPRDRLARIRCILECITCFRELKPLPNAVCYVPDGIEYKADCKMNVKVYFDIEKHGKKIDIPLVQDSRLIVSGEEYCNCHGKWLKIRKFIPSSGENEVCFNEPAYILLFNTKSASEESLVKCPSKKENGKEQNVSDNWLELIQTQTQFAGQRLSPPLTFKELDEEAVARLQAIPPGWSFACDEELVRFMSNHIPPDNDHLGSMKNYVESIDVSSCCDEEGSPSCLTDADPDTYWESDGSQGNHWIKIAMKKGTVIFSLKMVLDFSDDNYLPSKIQVEGGDVGNMKMLKEISIDWMVENSEEIILLENMTEHLPIIKISILECKGCGIDTRVRGIKIASSEGRYMGFDQDFFKPENLIRFPKLEGYKKEVLYRRSLLLQKFIELLDSVLPYIAPSWEFSIGTYESLEIIRQLLPLSKKRHAIIDSFLKDTSCDRPSDTPKLFINRRLAMEHRSDPLQDPSCKNTCFMQIYSGLKPRERSFQTLNYRWSSQYEQWWECKFVAEGVIDQGGGFRDSLSDLAEELCPTASEGPLPLPFFIRAPNQITDESSVYKDVYVPNPGCKEFQKYEWIGQLMGACLRGKENLILAFPAFVWKKLAGERVTWNSDYITVDSVEVKKTIDLQNMDKDKFSSWEFTWNTILSDGSNVIHKIDVDGNPKKVEYEDRIEYAQTLENTRMNEFNEQICAMRQGLLKVIPKAVLDLITWQELERRVCGDPEISLEDLRRHVHYDDLEESDTRVKYLWEALKNFNNEDRSRFLRFVTGRRRLPASIYVSSGRNEVIDSLPESSTCANLIYLPTYSCAKVAAEKLRYACYNCIDMDADVNPDE